MRDRRFPWFRDDEAETGERAAWLYVMISACMHSATVNLDELPDRIVPPRVRFGYGPGDPFSVPLRIDEIPRGLDPRFIPTPEARHASLTFAENVGHRFGWFQPGVEPPASWPR